MTTDPKPPIDYQTLLPGVPNVESPFFAKIFGGANVDAATLRIATDLHVKGYAIIDFPEPEFDAMAEEIKRSLHDNYDFAMWHNTGHEQGVSLRLQDAWTSNQNVRDIACNKNIIELLTRLYGKQAWPFQTLNFPVGSQQHYHTDAIHFNSMPERFMCGVWVALEDIDATNGPLVYFPGSHRWPVYTNEHIGRCMAEADEAPTQEIYEAMWRALVEAQSATPEYFMAKKGQALIWASNLMHGGARQLEKTRTRWAQVTHYFFEGCAYYTPMLSDPPYGSVHFRALKNILTGEIMPQQYAGYDTPPLFVQACNPAVERWVEAEEFSFDKNLYLQANPDVARAGYNPYEHYLMFGIKERRKLRP